MLILTRKSNESIHIDETIKITVLKVSGNKVRLGVEAPDEVRVLRGEVAQRDLEQRNQRLLAVTMEHLDQLEVGGDDEENETVAFRVSRGQLASALPKLRS